MIKPAPQPDYLHGMDVCSFPSHVPCLLRLLERHELGVAELCDILQLPSPPSAATSGVGGSASVRAGSKGTTHLYNRCWMSSAHPPRRLWLWRGSRPDAWPAVSRIDGARARLRDRRPTPKLFRRGGGPLGQTPTKMSGQSFSHAATLALLPAD